MNDQAAPVRVEVEMADGTLLRAAGDDAAALWRHWRRCEDAYYPQGLRPYRGPHLRVVRGPAEAREEDGRA